MPTRSWFSVPALVLAAGSLIAGCTPEPPVVGGRPERAGVGDPYLADVVERVSPSVVTVRTETGSGSGVVLRPDVIVTNQHVVGDARDVVVLFADGTESPASVSATDAITDLAVLRPRRQNLPAVAVRPDLPRPGERVFAVGSPLGFSNSVTAGIVSGLHREIPGSAEQTQSLVDLIQTDAAISPGNSGGALLDVDGRLVGINEAYIPPSAGAVSLGFAIPTATVLDITEQLLADGTAEHPYLGVTLAPLTLAIRERLGVRTDRGALVVGIDDSGPAAGAGVQPGDVIVRLGEAQVRGVEDLLGALRGHDPGQRVELGYQRGGEERETTVAIGAREG